MLHATYDVRHTMSKIKAVFFDAGGTLFTPHPSVGEIYAETSKRYGANCDPDVLETEFESAWRKRGGLSSLGSDTNEAKERDWWRSLVTEVFTSSGGVPEFGRFFDELHRSFVNKELWRIYPEVIETLASLRSEGMALGIVSNWDLRLPIVIENMGLTSCFDFVLGSSACGATKPSPKIFEEALKHSRTRPDETLHIGDTYHEDFLGAEGVGIRPIHLDRMGKSNHVPKERCIRSLDEIKRWVTEQGRI